MTIFRQALTVAGVLGLAGGYAASQWAYLHGDAQAYAQAADEPWVRLAAAVLLALAIVLSLIPEKEEPPS